jgi:hypothetical protein
MTHKDWLGDLPLEIEYDYKEHGGLKIPKIHTILLDSQLEDFRDNSWDLTEIIDHNLVSELNSRIFKVLNKEIYDK